jgi:putative Mg2+ transporter-C (MgtC) family protein
MDFILSHEPWNLLVRILVAAALGGILGIERDIHGRQAGLRTHLLVSAGAALFFILSTHIATFDVIVPPEFTKVTDPGRIAAQIVTGIGFLGAGVILKEGLTVIGLTTAACLWISAAIGMASGAGLYVIATSTTVMALFSLILLRWFERFYRKDIYRGLMVSIPNEADVKQVIDMVKSKEVIITFFGLERDYETQTTVVRMSLRLFYKGNVDKLSHLIVEKLEQSHIPLKAIKWLRP